jgi:hypothetical protein
MKQFMKDRNVRGLIDRHIRGVGFAAFILILAFVVSPSSPSTLTGSRQSRSPGRPAASARGRRVGPSAHPIQRSWS